MGREEEGGSQHIVLQSACAEEHTLIHEVYNKPFIFVIKLDHLNNEILFIISDFACPWSIP